MSSPGRARTQAALDLAAVIAIGLVLRMLVLRHVPALVAGPSSVVLTVVAATLLLRRRGLNWRSLGLARPSSLRALVGWTLLTYFCCMAVVVAANLVMLRFTRLPPQDLSVLAAIHGNKALYLYMLVAVVWGSAAPGEELLFRGFVMTRLLAIVGGDGFAARALAVLGQAALFAAGHAYLGPRGVIDAGLLGAVLATTYFCNGRNLWPMIIAHGMIDTLSITLIYFGFGLPH